MQVVDNEQTEKPKSNLLEYEVGSEGNMLILLSKLIKIEAHYLKSVNKFVICKGADECMYCAANYEITTEYNYWVDLNGTRGYLNIKPGVFFEIQKIAKAQKKEARQMSWTVIKTGAGLATEYTVSKDDNLASEDYEKIQNDLSDTTARLTELLEKHEERLNENYTTYLKDIRGQSATKRTVRDDKQEEEDSVSDDEPDPEKETDDSETVDPSDIPF